MIGLPSALTIYLAIEPVDMRKQFDGLWTVASQVLREDPFGGALFVFTNKRRNRVKLLYWDGTGVWVAGQAAGEGLLHVTARWRRREGDAQCRSADDVTGRNRPEGWCEKSVV
ncbi:MAG: IS66 family insertion sequence element accessory protein TnpB [Candidatus Synoicihabitans palmerolidicus]|nr:IS66 family insertion sequence element accessory protein TnpB [Candidatus Synoicihabitans palmerolidicus]